MSERFTPDRWAEVYTTFLENFPDLKAELYSGTRVLISDTELSQYGDLSWGEAALDAGEEILMGSIMASNRLTGIRGGGVIVPTVSPHNCIRLSGLRSDNLDRIVGVRALVKGRSEVRPFFQVALFQCLRCGAVHRVDQTARMKTLSQPLECYKENGGCSRASGSTKFRLVTRTPAIMLGTEYDTDAEADKIDQQWLEVQDPPEEMRGTEQPTSLKARLLGGDLMDIARPMDIVTLYGILKREDEDDKLVAPPTYLEVYWLVNESSQQMVITDDDLAALRERVLGCEDPLEEIILPSIAPHIKGCDDEKRALAIQAFRAIYKVVGTKTLRDTIHIMLLGDPGTAKSQLLLFVKMMTPRAVYTAGTGASKVGLTATTSKGEKGSWTVEPGALPLADFSTCCIDEAGELSEEEFEGLCECMQDMTVTKTKAGGPHTFNARTAILMAGNPKGGRHWDPDAPISEQVDITPAVLSRVDLFFVVRDDIANDPSIRAGIDPYYGCGDMPDPPPMTTLELAKFVMVAQRIDPAVTAEALVHFAKYHDSLRLNPDAPFTIRTYEGLIRMGIAMARMRFSHTVEEVDAIKAIQVHSAGWDAAVRGGVWTYDTIVAKPSKGGKKSTVRFNIRRLLEGVPDGLTTDDISKHLMALGWNITYKETEEFLMGEMSNEVYQGSVNRLLVWRMVE